MVGTVAGYRQIVGNFERSLNTVAAKPEIKREAEYFLANIRSVTNAEDFLANDRLYNFAMTAFGLKDMIYGKAFMRKVLTEGLDGEKSFALQLADTRFREFAEAFNFARYGSSATAFDRAQKGTVDRYMRIQLEADAGQTDEGIRLALYFQRKAPAVTSVYGIMADPALYKVVQTALGLPAAFSGVDIDRQADVIISRIALEDLQDTEKLDKLIVRFTAQWQATSNPTATVPPQIGLSGSLLATFDNSLLLNMQTLKSAR